MGYRITNRLRAIKARERRTIDVSTYSDMGQQRVVTHHVPAGPYRRWVPTGRTNVARS